MSKQVSKVDRASQVMLFIVVALLLMFLGTGIYFRVVDPQSGAGFVGIGVFLFGLGLVTILQTSVMKDNGSFLNTFSATPDGSTSGSKGLRAEDLEPVLKFAATINAPKRGAKPGTVYVCNDGVYFDGIANSLISMSFSGITGVSRDKKHIELSGNMMYAGMLTENAIVKIDVDNALRCKAMEQELQKHGIQ